MGFGGSILVGRSAIIGIGIGGTTTLSSSLLSSRAPLRLAFSSSLSYLSYHHRIPQIARTRTRLARPLYTYSGQLRSMNIIHPSKDGLDRDYAPISDHGLIGNLRTAALISLDGSVESYCIPNFDSPSVFARILDKDKGGHFSITPTVPFTSKQNYLPSTNILQTKFMNDRGVVSVTDFLPRPPLHASASTSITPLLPWLIRRIECVRGSLPLIVQCAPAFNYARDSHVLTIVEDDSVPFGKQEKAVFESANLSLDLRYTLESLSHDTPLPTLSLLPYDLSSKGHKGLGVKAELELVEGQVVTFVLRTPPTGYTRAAPLSTGSSASASASPTPPQLDSEQAKEAKETQQAMEPMVTTTSTGLTLPALPEHESKEMEMQARAKAEHSKDVRREEAGIVSAGDVRLLSSLPRGRGLDDPFLTSELIHSLLETTSRYWYDWIRQSTYKGSWKEAVHRSALALKLLIYEPTGAVVASPTFSLPEFIGGVRNWDYRASWIRDSSFTLYALIRLGFTEEANSYLEFIFERLRNKNPDGSLNIMYTIHGGKDFPEAELTHLDGHKGSKPVRIGNGAIDHIQLDIYGELMDCIYLGQKYGKPLSYDDWVLVRELVDFVVAHYQDPDLSIWEVRDKMRHFTYSKIMMWVALDRGIRLADKRSLPCPNRYKWLEARDALYEDIMHKAWNAEGKFFGQSYEDKDIVDAAVLIMPLVFFMQASDPRFVSTLKQILKSPERGGLTSNNLVYRYDTSKTEDGVGGDEGTFCLCTLWCVEALTRAGATDRALLKKGVTMFEDFLLYLNHVGLCTEEISPAGEGLGNAVQGFTHVTLISAAYNLSRTLHSAP